MDAVGLEEQGPDPEDAKARIRERGMRIQERERERALDRLRARRDLTEHEQRVVRELARRLTDALLDVPERHLDAVASGDGDIETAVALELFGEE